ncbi:MAG: 16S rRNA (cytosine(967)-C(5))-methyltransferase RsmB [Nevskiaceae bacterium]|nr:MAG: 16S rRNA (cytosine(967)-C(5))-methyltransferase RsmB [Nevskiaceae bacterium]TBR72570.1 MAG: 16S rRNA (cytosine(967)-C(5))-methyltransferase RsmB [Nevskiaceae bacterium]
MAANSTEGASVRAAAARAVFATLGGRNLGTALKEAEAEIPIGRDRALLQALAYGTVRDHRWLEALCGKLLRNLATTPPEVVALVEVGLHQLRDTRVPPHAAVSATVSACDLIGHAHARALVNAVLRRYLREARTLEAALPGTPALRFSCPDWLADTIRRDWPTTWRAVLEAGQQPGPMTLRVNVRATSTSAASKALEAAGMPACAVAGAPDALRLHTPHAVHQLPGFDNGTLSVQDAAAQLAAPLLDARPGMRVLDACAAPGGKTMHLLERTDELDLLALDSDVGRLKRITENLERLHLTAEVHHAEADNPQRWWNGKPFDRILLDAPCSGTGVIRRHPDIKWLRRPTDIPKLAAQQRTLLEALWPLLAPGGVLLYVTCSILDAEGAGVVEGFLRKHRDAQEWRIEAEWGEAARVGRRIAPGGDWDGFYYARLRRLEG